MEKTASTEDVQLVDDGQGNLTMMDSSGKFLGEIHLFGTGEPSDKLAAELAKRNRNFHFHYSYTLPTAGTPIGVRAGWVIEKLGGVTATSKLLGVSKSQPSRWRSGDETPSPERARELLDLDHVLARAELLWGDQRVVLDWLTGSNAYLGGATPLDVIRTRGVTEVIEALDEATSGAYA